MNRRLIWALAALFVMAFAGATNTSAATSTVVMSGLDNPRGLAFGPEGALYVTETGRGGPGPPCRLNRGMLYCFGATGAISRLWHGTQQEWVSGLPSMAPASGVEAENGPEDISFHGRGGAFVTMGLSGTPSLHDLGPQLDLSGWLLKIAASGRIKQIADLGTYEATVNPDRGLVDSNPFGLLALAGRQIVADAGGNSVLEVSANGSISTLAVYGARPNPLPIGPPGVESVETAVAQGPDGALYVSELTGVPFPTGMARIHRIAPDGTTSVYATGLTAVVDLGFKDGLLYALQHGSCGPFFACPGSLVRVNAPAGPHTVVYGGLSRPSAFTVGPDGAFYVSNNGASSGIGEVLRIQP
jgi:hypothetical protein